MFNTANIADKLFNDAKFYGFDVKGSFNFGHIKTARDSYIKRLNVSILQSKRIELILILLIY